MKKYTTLLITGLLAFVITANCQVQRLAILPAAMQGAENNLSSLCIDLFERAPEGNDYARLGSSEKVFHSDSYSSGTLKDGILNSEETQIVSTKLNDHPIPAYYKKFLDAKIGEYNSGRPLTDNELANLQDEIWAYNGMDQLGWINRATPDQVQEYNTTRESFSFRYDVDPSDYEAISGKAEHIHEIQKKPMPAPISDVQFSNSGLLATITGNDHSIDVSYSGVSFDDVKNYSSQVVTDTKKFYRIFHELPEEATFSIDTKHDHAYLLSFHALGDEYDEFIMNFSFPQNTSGFEIFRHQEIGSYASIQ
jgi:hypothetical protein